MNTYAVYGPTGLKDRVATYHAIIKGHGVKVSHAHNGMQHLQGHNQCLRSSPGQSISVCAKGTGSSCHAFFYPDTLLSARTLR